MRVSQVRKKLVATFAAAATLPAGLAVLAMNAPEANAALSGLVEVRAVSRINSDPGKAATVYCPAGKVVVGAGFATNVINGLVLNDIKPSATSVHVSVQEASPISKSWAVTAMAFCAKAPKGYQVVSATTTKSVSFEKTASVACPTGKQVIGSGVAASGAPGKVTIDELVPTSKKVSVKGFQTRGGNTGNWSLTAVAICSKPLPGQVVVFKATAASSLDKGIRSVCPSGKSVVSTAFDLVGSLGRVSPSSSLRVRPFSSVAFSDGTEQAGGTTNNWSAVSYAVCVSSLVS